ncbi:uncharacterized protein LOC125511399 [Triticum urartu]|uniref:uncharacterized protein LOC125511399 n=1 Tax=Triticum urartu TaxID=4572 RepID=UPI0020445423|nr:uncharacterized protein LOC125511399 [Triticum urartu]
MPLPPSPIVAARMWSSCAMAAMASMADTRGPSASAVAACSGNGVATSDSPSASWTGIRVPRSAAIELSQFAFLPQYFSATVAKRDRPPRRDADTPACMSLLRRTHQTPQLPRNLTTGRHTFFRGIQVTVLCNHGAQSRASPIGKENSRSTSHHFLPTALLLLQQSRWCIDPPSICIN